jgi:hypothetical protein
VSHKVLNLRSILFWAFRYEIPLRLKGHSLGFRIGLLLASMHFIFFVSNVLYMIEHHEGRWHMFWILCEYIDFPVSLLLTKIILPVFFHGTPANDMHMATNASALWIFAVFYAVAGTVWYFFLPLLLERAAGKVAGTTWTITMAVIIMLIPIFAYWLQLLRFIGGEAKCFVPGLYSILPIVWMVLLVWLYFTSAKRKKVLWLLLLVPFVFFYFVQDLYYYITLMKR